MFQEGCQVGRRVGQTAELFSRHSCECLWSNSRICGAARDSGTNHDSILFKLLSAVSCDRKLDFPLQAQRVAEHLLSASRLNQPAKPHRRQALLARGDPLPLILRMATENSQLNDIRGNRGLLESAIYVSMKPGETGFFRLRPPWYRSGQRLAFRVSLRPHITWCTLRFSVNRDFSRGGAACNSVACCAQFSGQDHEIVLSHN
jgi:hypothetical protein